MGKLNIAHHKSYHPYRRDNIERVRLDEEEARIKEAEEDGRIMLADSEARIDLLRQRAGIGADSKKKSRRQEEREENRMLEERTKLDVTSHSAPLPTTNGHINFFQDLEHGELAATLKVTKKVTPSASTEKGVPLAPSKEDLRPWYSSRKDDTTVEDNSKEKDGADGKRLRDAARKTVYDPLTSINRQLSSSSSNTQTHNQDRFKQPQPSQSSRFKSPPSTSSSSNKPSDVQARLARESSERERALALIRRKEREMMGSETPSTVHGGVHDKGYGDMFNKKEVEEARRRRERGTMHWGDEEPGGRRNDRPSSSRRW